MSFVLIAYLTRRNTGYIGAIVYLTTAILCHLHGWFPHFTEYPTLDALLILLWLEGYAGVLGSIGNDIAEGSFYQSFDGESPTTQVIIIAIHVTALVALTIPPLMVLFTLSFFALIVVRCIMEPELRASMYQRFR